MKIEHRLYAARAISSFGDWFTLMAVALFLNKQFGGVQVAYGFLISSLPSILISGWTAKGVPARWRKRFYVAGLTVEILALLLLTQATTLWQYYLFLLASSAISAALKPLSDGLVGHWVRRSKRRAVYPRLGAIGSVVLSIAPVLGGVIAQSWGYGTLFVLDAVSFLLALVITFPLLRGLKRARNADDSVVELRQSISSYPAPLRAAFRSWHYLLVLGAVINGVEFQAFANSGLTDRQVGLVLGAWGLGSLLVLLLPRAVLAAPSTAWRVALLYGTALGAFVVFPWFSTSLLSFAAAGFGSALLGGHLQSAIQNAIPTSLDSVGVWGRANRQLGVINLGAYALCSLTLPYLPLAAYAGLFALAAPALAVSLRRLP